MLKFAHLNIRWHAIPYRKTDGSMRTENQVVLICINHIHRKFQKSAEFSAVDKVKRTIKNEENANCKHTLNAEFD